MGRLKKETEANNQTQYSYDQSSNRIKKNITGTTPLETNYAYDANDRLIWEETQKANNTLATTEYYYDANGNQISKLFNDLTDQTGAAASISLETQSNIPNYEYWEYDGYNRLTTYHTSTTTAEYTYNAQGLRITKKVNGQETKHIWDGDNMVMELDGSDQVIDKYIRGNQLIKSDINGYYLHNAHGDVIQLADQQGTITRSYLYDAFGIEQGTQPNDPNPFRYCGEYLDNESGNVYLRARYYDPNIGRFISEDSVEGEFTNPISLNLYLYCLSNPVNKWDPSGHSVLDDLSDAVDAIKDLPDAIKAVPKQVKEGITENIDSMQSGMDAAGMTPILGDGVDVVNGTIYAARGKWDDAALCAGGLVPIFGDGAQVAKVSKTVIKDVKGVNKGVEQVLDKVKSYEQARNKGLDIIGNMGSNSKPYVGRLGTGEGKIIGRQSADGKVRWRIDYDPNKGPHINIEDFRNGKGADATKIVIPFEGNISTVESILKHLNK